MKQIHYRLKSFAVLALLAVFALPVLPSQPASAAERVPAASGPTARAWEHHIAAWTQRDLAAIAVDYAPNATVVINGRAYDGVARVPEVFRALFAIFDRGQNRIDPPIVRELGRDGWVYITWHFTPNGSQAPIFGTDTFLTVDGRIVVQTIASTLYYGKWLP